MAADLLARGLAATARDGALPALARFADLPSRTVPPTAERIEAWVGGHRGSYVADALATATLAAAHPRFCKRDAAGRHFRLDQPAITVEQGGATGVAGTNDQPAWQATLDYAAAVGIRTVQATRPAYELWCPQRQQPGLELTDDGHLLVLRSDVTLEGVGPRPKLTRMGYGGTAPTSYQTVPVSGNYWRGGGLYWSHDGGIGANTQIVVRNLEFDGGCPRTTETSPIYPPGSPNGWDVTDKGIWVQDLRSGSLVMKDVEVHGFRGELLYWAGISDATSVNRLHAVRCAFHTTCGDADNSTGGIAFFDQCEFGNAFQCAEVLGRGGHYYRNCRFYDSSGGGFSGGPDPAFSAYNYYYATRPDDRVPWLELDGCVFDNCANIQVGSWVRGSVRATDTGFFGDAGVGRLSDVDLRIDAWADQRNDLGVFTVTGPGALDQPIPGAPAGVFYEKPEKIQVRVDCRQTRRARENGLSYAAVFLEGGYVDADSIVLRAGTVEAKRLFSPYGDLHAIPYVTCERFNATQGGFTGGGDYIGLTADYNFNPSYLTYYVNPSGTGPWSIGIGNGHEFAHGVQLTFVYGSGSTPAQFLKNGLGLLLAADRLLYRADDQLVLEYNKFNQRWREVRYFSQGA